MNVEGICLAVVSTPYDFVAKDGINAGQRMTGVNFMHHILRADGRVVSVKQKEATVTIDPRIIEALPKVSIEYSSFMTKNERGQAEEVLKAESIKLL